MTSSALLSAVSAALHPRVSAAGGVCDVAESMDEAVVFLAAAPVRWRLILLWDGYGSHAHAREGMTYHNVTCVIQQLRGLPAAGLATTAKLLAFSDRIESVSAWMRALRFPDGQDADIAGFSLTESRWLQTVEKARAHSLSFQLQAALPGFTDTIPLVFPQ